MTPSFPGDTATGRRSGRDHPVMFRFSRRLNSLLATKNVLQD
jgi:hypothetical protein